MYQKNILTKNKIKEVLILSVIQKILLVITIIGGINWLLIGIFDFNLVSFVFMENSIASRITYTIVGICSLINIALFYFELI